MYEVLQSSHYVDELVLKECPPRPHWAEGPEYYGREVYFM